MIANDPPQDLYRLVYYSRNRISDLTKIVNEVDAILASSRRNNAKAQISGALIFNSGMFAQVLEGALSAVETTFERIQRDPRHGDVEVLAFEQITERLFPNWSMGYIGRAVQDEQLFSTLGEKTEFDAKRLDGHRVLSIMREIAMDEET